ncbi:hypothetical protein [Rhizobium leguminosarum]|uniref:hypothetical protein n=1 Tax=Rhizobium leguminosarum TaxID=384 RepID=UPI001441B24B|nr:hypothetical protein [Rhizobium leguminosarum]NKJ77811.1 hypothetical protein [Rhizobium leguminosarum bv. viciae]
MGSTEAQQRRERAVIRLITGSVAMGHLQLAKHWLVKKADVLGSLQLPECRAEFELCSGDIARMEEIEAVHGMGSALVLDDPSIVALMEHSLIPEEIIMRARSTGQLFSPSC